MGNLRRAIRAVKSARQHTTAAASEEGTRWPIGRARRHILGASAPTSSASAASLVDAELSAYLQAEVISRAESPTEWWAASTRCWLQKPCAISARRRRPWLVSTCLALLGGSTRTNGYFPSVRKKSNKNRGKNLDLDFFRFLAKNRDFRFRIRESSITTNKQ